jgi:hypothetical protein
MLKKVLSIALILSVVGMCLTGCSKSGDEGANNTPPANAGDNNG